MSYFNFGEHQIVLPDLNLEGKFEMKNDSSYAEKFIKRYKSSKHYREVLLPLKLQCLFNIKEYLGETYDTYLDLLAGIGISGKIFNVEVYRDQDHYKEWHYQYNVWNDFSEDCVEVLTMNATDNTLVIDLDMFKLFDDERGFVDFTFLDFNNNTLKKAMTTYKPVIDNAFAHTNKYMLINDCSITYLKYGEASWANYAKLLDCTVEELKALWYSKLRQYYNSQYPDWYLTRVEGHPQTSFLLFEKENKLLQINFNTKDNITVKTSLTNER